MTWISILGPKHTFFLVAVQPESSNLKRKKNSIAFGRAPQREAESQPISQSPGKQSVTQSVGQAGRQTGR